MPPQTIPPRIRWAVDVLDPQPGDQILEIGCGAGYAAELVCERLDKGRLLAIDRSESGVDRTKRRCADAIAAGRLTVRHIDLATLRVPVKRLDRAFAFNVNLFWVRDCEAEVALLHERISPGGALYLFYEVTEVTDVPLIVEKASEALVKAGFRVSVVESKKPAVIGLVGKR